jgi:hypothetical protein
MPLFLDTHRNVDGLTAAGVTAGHARDLEVQAKHGVRYVRYWYDEATGKITEVVEGA